MNVLLGEGGERARRAGEGGQRGGPDRARAVRGREGERDPRVLDLVERRTLRGLEKVRRCADREQVERELREGGDRRVLEGGLARPVVRERGSLVVTQVGGRDRADRGAPVRALDRSRHRWRSRRVAERPAAGAWRHPRVAARGRIVLPRRRGVLQVERDRTRRFLARVFRVVRVRSRRLALRVGSRRGGVGIDLRVLRDAEAPVRTWRKVEHRGDRSARRRDRRRRGVRAGRGLCRILACCKHQRRQHRAHGGEVAEARARDAHGGMFHQVGSASDIEVGGGVTRYDTKHPCGVEQRDTRARARQSGHR